MKQITKKQILEILTEGNEAFDKGDYQKAEQKFKECIAFDDGDPAPSREKIDLLGDAYTAWFRYAFLYFKQERWEEAIEKAQRALAIKPLHTWAYSLIGQANEELGRYVEAEEAYRKSLEAKPQPEMCAILANLIDKRFKDRKTREEEVVDLLYKSIELDPFYEESYHNLGHYFLLKEDFEQARRYFEAAIEIDPEYRHSYSYLAEVRLKLLKNTYDVRELEEISEIFLKAIEFDPKKFWNQLSMANISWRLQRYRSAHHWYRQALKAAPNESVVQWSYGDFLRCEMNFAKAEYHCRKAVEIDPDCPQANYFLGKLLVDMERFSEARKQLEIAENLGHPKAHELLAECEQVGQNTIETIPMWPPKKY